MAARRTHIDSLRDGFFDVLVVGGGDSALEAALAVAEVDGTDEKAAEEVIEGITTDQVAHVHSPFG